MDMDMLLWDGKKLLFCHFGENVYCEIVIAIF